MYTVAYQRFQAKKRKQVKRRRAMKFWTLYTLGCLAIGTIATEWRSAGHSATRDMLEFHRTSVAMNE